MSHTLERSLDILDCLAAHDEPLRLSQLANRIGTERSNTLRLLRCLEARGYVERDEFKRYSLGLTALRLARVVLRRLDVAEAGQEVLRALGHATGEATHLAVLQGIYIVYLGRVESAAPVRVTHEVGQREPAHCTAVGKALLAYLPASELQRLFPTGRLPIHTSHTLSTLRALRDDLGLVRERGYAFDDEELYEGVRCIAAPVRNHVGTVVASIGVSAPAMRLSAARRAGVAKLVKEHAEELSERLGCVQTA
jgi:IclR family transcriptional regulator, KDG regulon repressor